jgi:hypothetical protein
MYSRQKPGQKRLIKPEKAGSIRDWIFVLLSDWGEFSKKMIRKGGD